MKVKDLKELLARAPDDAEVTITLWEEYYKWDLVTRAPHVTVSDKTVKFT